jgi:hypothetical protein
MWQSGGKQELHSIKRSRRVARWLVHLKRNTPGDRESSLAI